MGGKGGTASALPPHCPLMPCPGLDKHSCSGGQDTHPGLAGTVPLQLEGSSQKCPTTSGLLSPKNTPREAVESSRAGRQPCTPALSHSPLHQASHGRLRPQLLPGDARAEGHQIPFAAGEDSGEHPEQCQCPLSPAGSGSCHGPGQCQHQRAQTAQGSG